MSSAGGVDFGLPPQVGQTLPSRTSAACQHASPVHPDDLGIN
jgi:hypothetical protein